MVQVPLGGIVYRCHGYIPPRGIQREENVMNIGDKVCKGDRCGTVAAVSAGQVMVAWDDGYMYLHHASELKTVPARKNKELKLELIAQKEKEIRRLEYEIEALRESIEVG